MTFAMQLDGPRPQNQQIRETLETEIVKLSEGEFPPRFPKAARLVADWSSEGIKADVDQACADPDTDISIVLGPFSSNEVGRRTQLSKPTYQALDQLIVGLFKRIESAAARWIHRGNVVRPARKLASHYQTLLARYTRLLECLEQWAETGSETPS